MNNLNPEYMTVKSKYDDLQKRGEAAIGGNVLEYMDSVLSDEERVESDLRVALIGEIIRARQEKGISQKQLGELSGVKQPVISRMESGNTSPQMDTVLKVLLSLGKTLAIIPLAKE